MLPAVAVLMRLDALVGLLFLKVYDFTVRETPPAVLCGLTLVYVFGYSAILVLSWLG